VRPEPQQVIQDPRDLVEHHPYVLRADRDLDPEQLLDRHHVGVLVGHHRDVVEPVHVRHRLEEGLVLGELLRGAMQEPDVRVRALYHLSVELEHEPQHAVRRGMLRPEVHRVVAYLCHVVFSATEENTEVTENRTTNLQKSRIRHCSVLSVPVLCG
jgi:hypothetical protein